jgi:acyl-CoA synthetase (AMP-forming)/AMP-acid ligase II
VAAIDTDIIEILAHASEHERGVEFVTRAGKEETTFHELWTQSSSASAALSGSNEAPIAGVLSPSAAMVACLIGALRSGTDFVSVPLPGRGQTSEKFFEQTRRIMALAGAETLVLAQHYAPFFAGLSGVRVVVAETLVAGSSGARMRERRGKLVQFSSGTTGVPKGVRMTTSAIGASVEATLTAIDARAEVSCQWVPLSHDMGLIGGLLATWAAGTRGWLSGRSFGPYICISPELFLARPLLWLETCGARGAAVTTAPTFAYQLVAKHLAGSRMLDLSRLRVCLVGAEPIHPASLEAFQEAARPHGFQPQALCPAYGLAEAALAVSIDPPDREWSTQKVSVHGVARDYVSCGRVLPCVQVRAEGRGNEPGRISIAGPAVCDGVFGGTSATSDGWRDTGDVGIMNGDELVVTGRTDDLLCIAGRNVFAWELEAEMMGCEGVRAGNCAVVADGRGRYVALFEPSRTLSDTGPVLSVVRARLAQFAGIGPSAVGCLRRGDLPKTPSGKVRRHRIASELEGFRDLCVAYREY